MTTIACDGVTIAADSQSTSGGEIISLTKQKIVIEHGYVFGLSGNYAYFETLRAWYASGCDPEKAPKISGTGSSWYLAVFREDDFVAYNNEIPYADVFPYPQSFGSGSQYALGAMKAGVDAVAAVRAAIELDTASGGSVQSISLREALRLARSCGSGGPIFPASLERTSGSSSRHLPVSFALCDQ